MNIFKINNRTLSSSIAIAALCLCPLSFAENEEKQLTLVIQGYEEQQGVTYLSLYDNADDFNNMNGKSVANLQHRLNGDSLKISFHDLKPGKYAVSLYHDANGNQTLDRNLLGIPSEQYGFSNNVGAFGPAKFDKASFVLDENKIVTIKLR